MTKDNRIEEVAPGYESGNLTVVALTGKKNEQGYPIWECRCECGGTHYANQHILRRRRVTQCDRCRRHGYPEDLTGIDFGDLKVLRKAPDMMEKKSKNPKPAWTVRCKCKKKLDVIERDLLNGSKTKCPTCARKREAQDLVGREFGAFKVVGKTDKYDAESRRLFKCRCMKCKKVFEYTAYDLRYTQVSACPNCRRHGYPEDLTGVEFGELRVIGRAEKDMEYDGKIRPTWTVECSCTNREDVPEPPLLNEKKQACKKCTRRRAKPLAGKKIRGVKVVRQIGASKYHNALWACKCVCEAELEYTTVQLERNQDLRCQQCQQKDEDEALKKEYLNTTYERLTVQELLPERDDAGRLQWRCSCSCGGEDVVLPTHLLRKNKSCGCLQRENQAKGPITPLYSEKTHLAMLASKKISSRNKSGVKGVSWQKKRRRWVASLELNGKVVFHKEFVKWADAVQARRNAEKEFIHPLLAAKAGELDDNTTLLQSGVLTGRRFSFLEVTGPVDGKPNWWHVECKCGRSTTCSTTMLLDGLRVCCDRRSCLAYKEAKKGLLIDSTSLKLIRKLEPNVDSTSGIRGVTWNKWSYKWQATLCLRGTFKLNSQHDHIEDAIQARKDAEQMYFAPLLEQYKENVDERIIVPGQRFVYLTAISYDKETSQWLFECKCGKKIRDTSTAVVDGRRVCCDKRTCTAYEKRVSGVKGIRWVDHLEKWRVKYSIRGEIIFTGDYEQLDKAIAALNKHKKLQQDIPRSGVKGVYWNIAANKWLVQHRIDGKLYFLGLYDDIDVAILARKQAEQRKEGESEPIHSGVAGVKRHGKRWNAYMRINGKYVLNEHFDDLEDAIEARRAVEEQYYGDDPEKLEKVRRPRLSRNILT